MLSTFTVVEGSWVKKGDTIGFVGSTGHSSGPHLHIEAQENGVKVDPEKYLATIDLISGAEGILSGYIDQWS